MGSPTFPAHTLFFPLKYSLYDLASDKSQNLNVQPRWTFSILQVCVQKEQNKFQLVQFLPPGPAWEQPQTGPGPVWKANLMNSVLPWMKTQTGWVLGVSWFLCRHRVWLSHRQRINIGQWSELRDQHLWPFLLVAMPPPLPNCSCTSWVFNQAEPSQYACLFVKPANK